MLGPWMGKEGERERIKGRWLEKYRKSKGEVLPSTFHPSRHILRVYDPLKGGLGLDCFNLKS